MSLNRVVLVGRMTRDPELRTTTTGKDVVSFSIAVDKRIKSADGDGTTYFRCSAWGAAATFVNSYLSKGRLVAVDGRIETRKYQDSQGASRETFEIVADNVQGLDRPRDDSVGSTSDNYDPFAGGNE